MSELIDFIGEILGWLIELLLWVPRKLYELILDGLAGVIEAIPVPAWASGADPFSLIDPGVAFFAEAFMLGEGIAILLGAYLLRFIVRRIPLVG